GDIAVAPSNASIVWVGTGEANNRQSSSWGDGVYKSDDAGRTWTAAGPGPECSSSTTIPEPPIS
ncbi:MAG TPA: hypothetical protein VFI56_12980, partial [Vicinamibacterales bacterium]|nr:hypothetical protein [Vicinamibacterales bacterium]